MYAPADHWGYNLLVEVALNAEFSPTGAVVTSGRVQSSRIFLYDTWRDFVRLVLEVLVVLYVWYFEMREEVQQITLKALSGDAAQSEIKALREWRRNFASALGEYWNAHFNFLDVMRIHVLYVWIVGVHVGGVWFTRTIPWRDLMFDRERDPTAYVKDAADVSFALQLARVRMMFVALYVALCFLKLLNIMRVQDDLFVIIIIEMFKKVISFLIVVLIIVSGFAFFAFFSRIGGSQAAMGGTPDKIGGGDVFWHTLFQQFAQLNGDFDFAESWHTAQLAGVAWTLFALVVLPILLMNLLIAIMSEAYEEVKAHAAARFCHLQLDTHSDEYARKRRQRLGGAGRGYTWEFLTQWMVLVFAIVFFPFLALYDLYCRACASLRALYRYTEGFFEIEEEFAGTETLARRQARRCFYACFAGKRASGAKVVPTTPKGGAAAVDDETLLRESRRRSENPLRK